VAGGSTMTDAIQQLWQAPLLVQAREIWLSGGWAMIALAVNALIIFAVGVNVWLRLKGTRYRSVSEKKWRRWISQPGERKGRVGQLIGFVMGAEDLHDMGARFTELHATELAPFRRDLRFMKRAVSTAPLLGLLGTVTGMLTTFAGLASGSGGQKTMDKVASGISEALITTETGLVIALVGLFLQFHLSRQSEKYDTFLARLETACTQYLCVWIKTRGSIGDDRAAQTS
jgi:biopolymer transport protein ExbB